MSKFLLWDGKQVIRCLPRADAISNHIPLNTTYYAYHPLYSEFYVGQLKTQGSCNKLVSAGKWLSLDKIDSVIPKEFRAHLLLLEK